MNKLKEFKKLLDFVSINFLKDFVLTFKNYGNINYNFNNMEINFINLFDYYFYTLFYQIRFILEN